MRFCGLLNGVFKYVAGITFSVIFYILFHSLLHVQDKCMGARKVEVYQQEFFLPSDGLEHMGRV